MLKLGVNIDHVASVRQARGGKDPDPLLAARICQASGAHSVVMHLREDRRHIQDADLFRVKKAVSIKLNLEMSIAKSIWEIAGRLSPEQVTLVPEKRQEKTTEGGLDLSKKSQALKAACGFFKKRNILVSLFIDPDPKQVSLAKALEADSVEFHTGFYANAKGPAAAGRELRRLEEAVELAMAKGLRTHAGHGLDYQNVIPLKKITGLEELNIGYSIVTRALWVGFESAVKEMLELISK